VKKIILSVRNLRKSFFNRVVIDNLSFDVFEAELVSVLGPSGCGKSTLIRLINGLERCDDKNNSIVEFRGKRIENFSPNERVGINTVFQGYALFPHLNVFENVAYGLRASKRYSGQEAILRKKVMQALKMVRLKNYQERSIESLSGGEGQRVALARALINQPGLLLLDEPFSALDPRLKEKMVIEIRELKSKVKTAFLFVTHDHSEALSLSDRVILLNDGKIQQIASPTLIYDEPVSP